MLLEAGFALIRSSGSHRIYLEVAEQTPILASAVFSGCLLPCQGKP